MIFTAQKERYTIGSTIFTQIKSLDPPYPDVAALAREIGHLLPPDALNSADWSLTDTTTAIRLRKMRAASIPLGEYVNGRIYYGVKTGLSKAFQIDGTIREKLITQSPESEKLIKPLLLGRDIRKWQAECKDRWLLYLPHRVDVSSMPAVLEHLEPYKEQLDVCCVD